ncbi:MAG: branched-chain amino acid ABC transporter permease, partial [Oscillospiraceae bacterium]|nr:branched-chain amino acid ABC transporter permease [Oscillospiraceae bacterium]
MEKLKNIKWNHYLNYIVVAAVTVIFAILSLTGVIESSDKYLLEKVAIAITLAVSLSMVVGFLGELSLGHAGFMCIGAYLGGKASVILEPVLGEWPALIVSL